jgi:hypothetical protein
MVFKALEKPDPARPDEPFVDGESIYQVATLPAAAPLAFALGSTGFDDLVFAVGIAAVANKIDRRWKVVVLRSRNRPPAFPRVMALEFLAGVEDAEARQIEILASWENGQFADRRPVGLFARGSARRASR